jgi:uncharacterized protein YdaU (DUF1376 family)
MADTRHLTAAQHGAYLLLLMTAWRMPDCKLPDDDRFLCRCASMDIRTWKLNRDIIMAFWKQDDEQKWYQGRLEDERKYVDDMRSKNAAAGRASALKRKNRHSTTVPTKPQRESNPHTHTLPTPIPIKESVKKHSSAREIDYSPEFEVIWKLYPPNEGSKFKAFEAYQKSLKTGVEHGRIESGVRAYADSVCRERTEKRYVAHAATWLNQRRWESDYSASQPSAQQPTKSKWVSAAEEYIAAHPA